MQTDLTADSVRYWISLALCAKIEVSAICVRAFVSDIADWLVARIAVDAAVSHCLARLGHQITWSIDLDQTVLWMRIANVDGAFFAAIPVISVSSAGVQGG